MIKINVQTVVYDCKRIDNCNNAMLMVHEYKNKRFGTTLILEDGRVTGIVNKNKTIIKRKGGT